MTVKRFIIPVNAAGPIQNLRTTSVTQTTIALAWDAYPGATAYEVRRNGTLVLTTANTTYSNSSHTAGTSYTYTVRPVVGGSGVASAEASIVVTTAGGSWQLGTGRFVNAKIPLQIIAPIAGLTTGATARSHYYRCYPGLRWRVPVAVMGGAWPFRYELVSAPAGVTLGEFYGSPNYGVIEWLSPVEGSYAFSVRVTDQQGAQAIVSWTLTVTTANAMFLDAVNGSNTTGNGTLANPYQNFYAWTGSGAGSRNLATYANYHVYYRAGTYSTVNNFDPEWTNFFMPMRQKPFVHLAYPGESVTFRINNGAGRFGFVDGFTLGSVDDLFFRGITFSGIHQGDAQYFQISRTSRVTFFENTFAATTSPGVTGTNPAYVLSVREGAAGAPSSLSTKQYTVFHSNTISHIAQEIMWETYDTQYAVIENNSVLSSASAGGDESRLVYWKENSRYASVRNNRATSAVACELSQCGSSAGEYSNIEVCWNLWRVSGAIHNVQTGIETSRPVGPNWIFRNTFIGGDVYHQGTAGGTLEYTNNVRQFTNGTNGVSGSSSLTISGLSTDVAASSELVYTDGNLTPDYSAFSGTHGHKVA